MCVLAGAFIRKYCALSLRTFLSRVTRRCSSVDSTTLRNVCIFGALALNLLLITVGVAFDIYVMVRERREDVAQFLVTGMFVCVCAGACVCLMALLA